MVLSSNVFRSLLHLRHFCCRQVMSGTDQLLTVAEHFKPVFEKTVKVAAGWNWDQYIYIYIRISQLDVMICCDDVRITPSCENFWSLSVQTSQALCQDVQNQLIKESQDNSQELRFLRKRGLVYGAVLIEQCKSQKTFEVVLAAASCFERRCRTTWSWVRWKTLFVWRRRWGLLAKLQGFGQAFKEHGGVTCCIGGAIPNSTILPP